MKVLFLLMVWFHNYIKKKKTIPLSIPSFSEMEEVPEMHDTDKDLLYMHCVRPVKVYVHDDIYELIGEISSSSDESEVNKGGELES